MNIQSWRKNVSLISYCLFFIAYGGYSLYMYIILMLSSYANNSISLAWIWGIMSFAYPLMMLVAFVFLLLGVISSVVSLKVGPGILCLLCVSVYFNFIDSGLFSHRDIVALMVDESIPTIFISNALYNALIILLSLHWGVNYVWKK